MLLLLLEFEFVSKSQQQKHFNNFQWKNTAAVKRIFFTLKMLVFRPFFKTTLCLILFVFPCCSGSGSFASSRWPWLKFYYIYIEKLWKKHFLEHLCSLANCLNVCLPCRSAVQSYSSRSCPLAEKFNVPRQSSM